MSVPVSTVSSKSCFSLTGRVIEEAPAVAASYSGDVDLCERLGVGRCKSTR